MTLAGEAGLDDRSSGRHHPCVVLEVDPLHHARCVVARAGRLVVTLVLAWAGCHAARDDTTAPAPPRASASGASEAAAPPVVMDPSIDDTAPKAEPEPARPSDARPLAEIHFQPGSTKLTPESEQIVDELAPTLRAGNRGVCVFMLDDGVGSSSHTAPLRARRARVLEQRLVAAGAGEGNFQMRSRFVERPADPPLGWSGSGTALVEPCP
jgi:outer membrane protein OmpA-like peptidoglycan-associated protein